MTAIILAGGKASRMKGDDKAFLKIDNEPLIKRQLRLLKDVFRQIIIVTNTPKKYKNFRGVKVVSDLVLHHGPLGGIFSGLLASKDKYNFVVACDMPFLNLDLIKYMASRKDNFDAVIPKLKKGYEPLFAIYSKDCISKIYKILRTGNLKVLNLFKKIKLRELDEEQISKFGDSGILFMNINSKDDLVKIKKAQRSL